jgi:hypothetical protein
VQSVPRPPSSVPLGGSLRASRAALLARPHGPLVAVDLADGRSLVVEHLGAGWVASAAVFEIAEQSAPRRADDPAAPVRRRRLGTAVVLAGALGAAVVALATGFSGAPAPAVAGPIAQPLVPEPAAVPALRPAARGGRAAALPLAKSLAPPPAAPPAPPPAMPAAPPAAAAPPAPPPLPELPSVPGL